MVSDVDQMSMSSAACASVKRLLAVPLVCEMLMTCLSKLLITSMSSVIFASIKRLAGVPLVCDVDQMSMSSAACASVKRLLAVPLVCEMAMMGLMADMILLNRRGNRISCDARSCLVRCRS